MLCKLKPDGQTLLCEHCGRRYLTKVIVTCTKQNRSTRPHDKKLRSPRAIDCPHIWGPLGESIKTINCGCGNSTSLYECLKFGRDCAPMVTNARGSVERDDVLLCRDCEYNPKNHNAESTA